MNPIKRGIKVWMRADSISYFIPRFQVYLVDHKVDKNMVLESMLCPSCRLIWRMDVIIFTLTIFFSTFGLMKTLLEKGIYPNRNRFPALLKTAKLSCGESIVMQKSALTACSRQDKKKVNFSTTNGQPNGQGTVQRRNRDGTLTDVDAPPSFHCITNIWVV